MSVRRVDLHCHTGGLSDGTPVKIAADRKFTIDGAITVSQNRNLDMVALVDCHVDGVLCELMHSVETKKYEVLASGGVRCNGVTIIFGSELDVCVQGKSVHILLYYPDLTSAQMVGELISGSGARTDWSCQRIRGLTLAQLCAFAHQHRFMIVPAHVFTPYRGLLAAVDRLSDAGVDTDSFSAIELGLSADAIMASGISDVNTLPYLSSSDAHSAAAIGREYADIDMVSCDYEGLYEALRTNLHIENYGLWPELGKYYLSVCRKCRDIVPGQSCGNCNSNAVITGVKERSDCLSDTKTANDRCYHYVLPLKAIAGIGEQTINKLLSSFSTERSVYEANPADISRVAGKRTAEIINKINLGQYRIIPGGGGKYGRIEIN